MFTNQCGAGGFPSPIRVTSALLGMPSTITKIYPGPGGYTPVSGGAVTVSVVPYRLQSSTTRRELACIEWVENPRSISDTMKEITSLM